MIFLPLRRPPVESALGEIEVFKTNIDTAATGTAVACALRRQFPALQVSLDLDDCDRVLRIRAPRIEPDLWTRVAAVVRGLGVAIEVLPD